MAASEPFAEAFGVDPAASAAGQPAVGDDDGFGDFGAFEEPPTNATDGHNDDGFGNFDDAEGFGDFEAANQEMAKKEETVAQPEPQPAAAEQQPAPKYSDPFAEIIHKTFNINFDAKRAQDDPQDTQQQKDLGGAQPAETVDAMAEGDFGDFSAQPAVPS